MLFRKAAFVVTVLLIVAALGVASWIWSSKNRLYSSPTVIRTNDTYLNLFIEKTNLPVRPTNLLSAISIDRSSNQVQLTYPSPVRFSDTSYGKLHIHRAGSAQSISVSDGSMRLAYIGFGSARPLTNFDSIQVSAEYFTPDLKPSSPPPPEILPAYERTVNFHGQLPTYQFVFAASNLTEMKVMGVDLFDARTKFALEHSSGSSHLSNAYWFETSVSLWHQTPVELIFTVALGPVLSYPIELKEGFQLNYPGGELSLLMMSDQEMGGSNSRYDGRTNVVRYKLGTQNPYYKNRPMCSFLFYSWPQSFGMPIEFEFFDHSGKKIPGYRSGSSNHLITQTILAHLGDVKEVRLKYYPNLHRLIYTLPELPGLPEQNRNIKNLFDVHVPYVHFRNEYAFQDTVGRLVQMDPQMLRLTYPNSFFPTFRTNTTARELFLEMESMLTNKELQLTADPKMNTISARPNPITKVLEAIKKKIGL